MYEFAPELTSYWQQHTEFKFQSKYTHEQLVRCYEQYLDQDQLRVIHNYFFLLQVPYGCLQHLLPQKE
jgi:hypothetical protein